MAINKMRLAIAGSGMVTDHHCRAWAKLPHVEVAAICSRRYDNAERRALQFGIPAVFDDYTRMLDTVEPDAVDIATVPEVHFDQVLEAADRGIHVLCQKPMTPSLADSRRLVDQVADRVRFMVHENWRFRPQYRRISTWLNEDKLGTIHDFKMTVRSSGLITRSNSGRLFAIERQPFFTTLKRFMIMEVLIHHLDTMRFLLGDLRVTETSHARICQEIVGEDFASISLRTESGAQGNVTGNFSAAGFPPLPVDDLELIGDRGSVIFRNQKLSLLGSDPEEINYDRETAYQQSYDNAIAHFVACMTENIPFETDRIDNLATLQLVEDAYLAAER
ncbi:MAG: Gfo/Idh/MocA family oxidoreductase [Desulfofustis sp.]|jgi:predicted dehydrogenase|nr:Gfo/Idh/MocA family oxidoreductase [Desulfofustis sp.]